MIRYIYIFLLFVPLISAAQTTLTLDECISLAKERNKKIEAAEYGHQAAYHEVRSARANFFPSFSATATGLYATADGSLGIEGGMLPVIGADGIPTGTTAYFPGMNLGYDIDWVYGAGIKVEQPLFTGGKITTGYHMAKLGRELAFQNKRLTESEVVVETARAYADVVQASELKRVAEAYHSLLTELMRSVEEARMQGMAPQNDVLTVRVKLNESELSLRRAGNGMRLATMNLCRCIGRPLTENISIVPQLPEIAPLSGKGDISERPEHRMLEQQSELARYRVKIARSERLPQIGIFGQYGYLNGINVNGKKLLDDANFVVGMQISVPIFHFGQRSNKLRAAKAQYAQTVAEQENADSLLSLELAQAENNLDEALLELQLAESTVAAADENLNSSGARYKVGMVSLSDYLEAQAMWQQARQTLVEAKIGSYLKWLEYQKATGRID